MALTKISTGGVKDDTTDEAKLKVSNAGSNGQFLSKQSGNTGGLTWADANSYTHPNHSGEVTSTADGAQVIASNIVDEDNLKISNAGTNGQYLQKQSGNTGGLTWADVAAGSTPVVITANRTAVSGDLVVVNGSGLTVTLPASPSVGNYVEVRILGSRYCTVARNSSNIESTASDFYVDVFDGYTKLIYADATRGWLIAN